MKLLVATKETQGKRKNDFCFCDEGEIVIFPVFECDRERIDGDCGCRRSMVGTKSRKATTTMKVIDSITTCAELENIIRQSLDNGGWLKLMDEKEIQKWITRDAKSLVELAASFNIGDIIEKRGNKFRART